MPSDFSMRAVNVVHRVILKLTGGRLGWDVGGMPALELVTIGRKTGQRRAAMLTSPLRVDGSYVIVASKGGDDNHPAWFLNLHDNPRVEVVIKGGPPEQRIARIADERERAVLWPRVVEKFANYGVYQTKTDREIPLVLLDPLP